MLNEELKKKLNDLGLTDEQITGLEKEGVTVDSDMQYLNADQIKAYSGCGMVTAIKIVEAFKPVVAEKPNPESSLANPASYNVLPQVPEDSSFIEALKTGGTLKVGKIEVMSAMKAAIATSVGLFNLPDIIQKKMEEYAEEQEEPVGSNYFELQKMIASRSYGDILSVLGVSGNFMSDARKKAFLIKLNTNLWEAIKDFNTQLIQWQESWSAGINNPGNALAALAWGQQGKNIILPPNMTQPPDTSALRDEAEVFIDKVNKIFAGVGIPVARALAYDATRIKNLLEEPGLPAALGVTSKDQMLKMLGVTVGADYVRLERQMTGFILAIMEVPHVNPGNEEYLYFGAMITLSLGIPWNKLSTISVQAQNSSDRKKNNSGDDKVNHY